MPAAAAIISPLRHAADALIFAITIFAFIIDIFAILRAFAAAAITRCRHYYADAAIDFRLPRHFAMRHYADAFRHYYCCRHDASFSFAILRHATLAADIIIISFHYFR